MKPQPVNPKSVVSVAGMCFCVLNYFLLWFAVKNYVERRGIRIFWLDNWNH